MKKLGLLLSLTVLIGSMSFAQQKWGHINSNELLKDMPELKKVQSQLEDYSKQLDGQNNEMLTEYQTKVASLNEEGASLAPAIQEVKVKEIQDLEARITDFQNSAGSKLSSKEIEMLQPVMDKIQNAINEVAQENDYTYIIDTSSGAILYWPLDSYDIMPLVKLKLGI